MTAPQNLRLIFIRHPETEWENVKDPESKKVGQRLLGSTDIGLSEKGYERAIRLSRALKKEGITHIFSSPLKRALTTAQQVSGEVGVAVLTRPALREIDFGECEGRTFEELAEHFPAVHKEYLSQGDEVSFPGGESFSSLRARVEGWLDEVLSIEEGVVAIVTHGGVTRVSLCSLLRWPPEMFWNIRQDYGALNVIGIYGDRRIIECLNSSV